MKPGKPRSDRPPAQPAETRPALLLQQALAYHRQGDARAAKERYETILQSQPSHFDALHLLGILEYQAGQPARALELLSRALHSKPGLAAPHANLGLAQQALHRYPDAQRSFEQALAIEPDHPEALNNLGNLLREIGQPEAALPYFEQALRLKPEYAGVLNNRGNTLRDLGRHADAIASFDAALKLDPAYAAAHYNRGNALQELGQPEAAVLSYQQALRLKPEVFEAWLNLGNALQELGQYAAALASYEQALQLRPDSAQARINQGRVLQTQHQPQAALLSYEFALRLEPESVEALRGRADVLRELNRHQEALACAAQALQRWPDDAPLLNSRGITYSALGQFTQAQADFRRAIDLAPERGGYYRNLVQAGPLAADDAYFVALERLAQRADTLTTDDRVSLHFALGEALEKLGRQDRSFAHYLQANALQRQRTHYPEPATLALLQWYRQTFTAPFLQARQGWGEPSTRPVFVVGMPRSGSTLIEQILDSHPAMFGVGERGDLAATAAQVAAQHGAGRAELETLAALAQSQWQQLGRDYLQRIGQVAGVEAQHRRLVDKGLLNFVHLGLIHLALPNARLIHIRRAPVETCLSCFSKWFDEVPFSYDLGELGRYYRAYDELMAHWRTVLPAGVLLEVQYEELVGDFDTQARRLVAHCGLEWDDACSAFYRNRRAVATSSVAQVRQPLYRHALTRWRPAAELLQPLLDGLGPALAGPISSA